MKDIRAKIIDKKFSCAGLNHRLHQPNHSASCAWSAERAMPSNVDCLVPPTDETPIPVCYTMKRHGWSDPRRTRQIRLLSSPDRTLVESKRDRHCSSSWMAGPIHTVQTSATTTTLRRHQCVLKVHPPVAESPLNVAYTIRQRSRINNIVSLLLLVIKIHLLCAQ